MSRVYEQDFFVKAGIERVWQALTTPAEMEKWLGMKVLSFDGRQGGKLQFEGLSAGEVVAFQPPHKLAWSWDPEDGSEPGVETLTLQAADGGTRIHVHALMVGRWADELIYRAGTVGGWRHWMDGLAGWVERGAALSSEPFGALGASWDAREAGDGEQVVISKVKPGGAAEAAGLQVGDVLLAWNEQPLDEVATFWVLVWRSSKGMKVRFMVDRGGQPTQAEVVLA